MESEVENIGFKSLIHATWKSTTTERCAYLIHNFGSKAESGNDNEYSAACAYFF